MFSGFFLTFVSFLTAAAGGAPALAAPDRVVTVRFPGLGPQDEPSMTQYVKGPQGWQGLKFQAYGDEMYLSVRAQDSLHECLAENLTTFGQQAQLFAVNKFLGTGMFNLRDASRYLKGSTDFTDRPITYLFYASDRPPTEDLTASGAPEHRAMLGFTFEHPAQPGLLAQPLPASAYLRASLSVLAGNKVRVESGSVHGQVEPLELPWTQDPDFVEQAREKFNRGLFPLVWELGRGARTEIGEFPELLGMAGVEMLRQTQHMGQPSPGMVDKGYVTFHTLTEENTGKMETYFPGRIFLRKKGDSNNVVFLIPLNEYLQRFPPENYSSSHKLLAEKLDRKLSPGVAQAFLESLKYVGGSALDFRYRGRLLRTPLLFNSQLTGGHGLATLESLGRHFGLSEAEVSRLADAEIEKHIGLITDPLWPGKVVDPGLPYALMNPGRVVNADPPYPISSVLIHRAFQISNLDPDLAARDPDYAKATLVAGFDHVLNLFLGKGIPANEIPIPELMRIANILRQSGLRFMVTTQFPGTAAALSALKPETLSEHDLAREPHSRKWWDQLFTHAGTQRPSYTATSAVFSVDQLLRFRMEQYAKPHPPKANPGDGEAAATIATPTGARYRSQHMDPSQRWTIARLRGPPGCPSRRAPADRPYSPRVSTARNRHHASRRAYSRKTGSARSSRTPAPHATPR